MFSICYAPDYHLLRGAAADGACVAQLLLLEGHAAARNTGQLLHLQLAGLVAAPHGLDEAAAAVLDDVLHLVHRVGDIGVLVQVALGLVEEKTKAVLCLLVK